MILFIDTTDFNRLTFALSGKKLVKRSCKVDAHNSHETLGQLDKFLKLAKIHSSEIQKIIVNKGPGSFTGVRVGAAHSLALSLGWGVPMQALPSPKFYSALKKRPG